MQPDEYRIQMHVARAGHAPFEAWIKRVRDPVARQRVYARIDRLRLGNFGDCRGLGRGLLELRIHHGHGMRVYFTVSGRRVITLLCGGSKATQERDIKRARRYREEATRDAKQKL